MRKNLYPITKAQGKIEHFLDQEVPQIIGWMVIVAIVFLFLFFAFIPGAEASNYRPPQQPERGAVELIQNQGQRQNQNQGQSQHAHSSSESHASTDGNTQTLGISQTYKDRAVRAVLGGAVVHSYTNDPECWIRKKPEWNLAGVFAIKPKAVEIEGCEEHKRSMDKQRLILEKAKLLYEIGQPSEAARILGIGGGNKPEPEPTYVTQDELTETVGRAFEKSLMK